MTLERQLRRSLERLGLQVPEDAIPGLLRLLEELGRWNLRVNLTAIADPVAAVEKHLVDSLTLLPLLDGVGRLLDIGSGAGFPALPLKIARPALEVVSVEAVGKKVTFQRHIARLLELEGFRAVHGRIEDLPGAEGWHRGFDLVVARAVASLTELAGLALPCLGPRGRLVAMKGPEGRQELVRQGRELASRGLVLEEIRELTLPQGGLCRQLLVFRAAGE